MGVVVSSSHVSAASSSSGRGLLTHFSGSAWGPSHERQISTNFCKVSPSHRPQFFTNCPSVGPFHRVQSCRNGLLQCQSQALPANLLQHGLLSPQVLARPCSSTGSAEGDSLLRAYICSGVGSSTGCRCRSALPWTSMGCNSTACLTMVFVTGCGGKKLHSGILSTSSPSFFTDLGVCRVFSHIVSLLSLNCHLTMVFFSPCLKKCYHRGATTVTHWVGLGQQRVYLRASWHCLYQTWGKLLTTPHRSHPYSSPGYQNLATQTHRLVAWIVLWKSIESKLIVWTWCLMFRRLIAGEINSALGKHGWDQLHLVSGF